MLASPIRVQTPIETDVRTVVFHQNRFALVQKNLGPRRGRFFRIDLHPFLHGLPM
jgi:hypothetical protein